MKKLSLYALMFATVATFGFAVSQARADDAMMTTTAAPAFSFTTDLTLGSTGNDVLQLQKFLNETPATVVASAPFAGSSGKETSAFGPKTAAAVMVFQTANGIPSTGVVGPLTRAAINKMLAAAVTTNTTTATPPAATITPVATVTPPTVSSLEVDMTKAGSATVSANYDGKGQNPTIWFAYGADPSAMTILSAKVASTTVTGSSSVTISDLGTGKCFVAMFAQTSAGTVNTGATACSK